MKNRRKLFSRETELAYDALTGTLAGTAVGAVIGKKLGNASLGAKLGGGFGLIGAATKYEYNKGVDTLRADSDGLRPKMLGGTKSFSEDSNDLDELYNRFKEADKEEAKSRRRKATGAGAAMGMIPGAAIGCLVGKSLKKPKTLVGLGIGALTGAGIGGVIGNVKQRKQQLKDYESNHQDLENIYNGFKSEKDRKKFLETLENELKDKK